MRRGQKEGASLCAPRYGDSMDVYFNCIYCTKALVADESGFGKTYKCTDCGEPVQIPRIEIEWECSCGVPIGLPSSMVGKTVQCVECGRSYKVPEIEQSEDTPKQKPLPVIETSMPISDPPQQDIPIVLVLKQNAKPTIPSTHSQQQGSPKNNIHSHNCPVCGAVIKHEFGDCLNCEFNRIKKNILIYGGSSLLLLVCVVVSAIWFFSKSPASNRATHVRATVSSSNMGAVQIMATSSSSADKPLKTPDDFLKAKGIYDVTSVDRFGDTPLHFAATEGNIILIDSLISKGADINARNDEGMTPLMAAIIREKKDSLEHLIKRGARINVETSEKLTPLHVALSRGFYDGVNTLIQSGAKLDARDKYGNTPLHMAIGMGRIDIAASLITSNINIQNDAGEAPIHLAVAKGSMDGVVLLMLKGANANILNKEMWAPLHLAIKAKNYDMASCLIQQGVDVDVKGSNNITPLHMAALYDSHEIMEALVRTNANINTADVYDYTPLDYAIANNSTNAKSLLNSKKGYSKIRACITCKSCGGSRSCSRCYGYKQIKCPTCFGTGMGKQTEQGTPLCSACGGKAKITCPECGGSGKCLKCDVSAEKNTLENEKHKLLNSLPSELKATTSSGM